ncbi:MAG TPA: protease pro-enzyme activation domain-containing protein [Verrucomicrobiae bacterium]|nr:protease pro-enzyme activation domain-containing protein [Verrucomicrobiae bacterium]
MPGWRSASGAVLVAASLAVFASGGPERQVLPGHVPPAVSRLKVQRALAGQERLQLALGLPLRDKAGLTNFLRDLYNPVSPRYGQFLTAEQFTERFGPSLPDYQRVIEFARTNGFSVMATHPNRLVLDVTAPVADIEKAFGIRLNVYQHPSEARTFYAPDANPSVPVSVPILDVSGLDNFVLPHPMDLKPAPLDQVVSNATGSGPGGDFLGRDFRAAYAPGVSLTGVGQVIGLFQFGPYFSNDIPVYEQATGLPITIIVTNVLLDGFTGVPAPGADDGEEALDIEMAMSMAPGAVIVVYEGNSAYDIFNRMATDNLAKQMSCSWGFSPPPSGMDNIFLEFAAQGQTLFVASGDGGAYNSSQTIFSPADDPNITSVGGTSLTTSGAGGPWQSESAWGGSGGGWSAAYAIPTWQQGLNMSANHGSTTRRNLPDVAMLAEPMIYFVFKNGQSGTVGGTSAASPLWGGFMALVNQQAAANGKPPLGFLNPVIYSLGRSAGYAASFHDITAGQNTNAGSPTNYYAVAGYDLCTGWGTPNGANFINALAGPNDPLQITPGIGFVAATPYGSPFRPVSLDLSLTNTGTASLDWSLGNTSVWLNASSPGGTIPAGGPASVVTVTLKTATATNMVAGNYYANVWFTNLSSGIVQSRLFTLVVSSANWPLMMTGFNAGIIVPNNATPANPQATGFDIANGYCFYQAGLNTNSSVASGSGGQGFPQSGSFTSLLDNMTVFQFGPYGATNALMLGYTYPNSGTLALANPQSFNSLAILAASANANSSSLGALVVHFTDGTSSQSFNLNAQDWYNATGNVALEGFGRLKLGTNPFSTENPGAYNPSLYQTTVNLAALGLNQPVASITFTKPTGGTTLDTAVLAVSGAIMPAEVNITQQPQSITNTVASQGVTFAVTAMGEAALAYQWYFSPSGYPGTYATMSGQNSASLALNPVLTTNNAGSYYAVVTNSYNAVASAVATLTIFRAPVITRQPAPANLALFAGQTLRLTVAANAAQPLAYSWNFNGTAIAGANSASYALTPVQTINSGIYSVVLTNAFGAVTSSPVSLVVQAAPTYPLAQAVLADHPIAYWPLDELSGAVAHDYVGGKNGVYSRVLLNQPGDNLIDTRPAARFGGLSSYNSCVTNIPIDFATSANAAFSVEAWVNGGAQNNDNGLVTKGTGAGGEQFNLDCGAANHGFRFFVRDAGGGAHLANGSAIPNNKWRHLVGVCDEINAKVILYVDGVSNASGTITAGSGLLASVNPASIGSRQSGAATAYDLQFVGTMEEVAVYNYALSATRVQAHFKAATNRPPVWSVNPFSQPALDAGQGISGTVSTNASDPNGDAITFAKANGPGWLSVAANGTLSGTPLSADIGTNVFLVSATDPGGLSSTATLDIAVNPGPPINAAFSLETTNLLLSWNGGIGPYSIQMATNLDNPNWQTILTMFSATNLVLTPSNAAGFYRIIGQ